jgi:cytochrome d ubiquinol oxidase subunit II
MEYQVIWFALWGLLWAVYFMLDGFDFGVGMLQRFLAANNTEKRVVINTIGPVWDGNEVWLITAGGATFAAFPTAYALMFSYLYSALLIILFALILRGVAFEFRGKGGSPAWERGWDAAIFVGSFIPSLLFGVAFGNIFRGLPMDGAGYHGTLLGLLNPYGIVTGLFFVLLFAEHGALWLARKTHGELADRAGRLSKKIWLVLAGTALLFLAYTAFATSLYANYYNNAAWGIVPVAAVASLAAVRLFSSAGDYGRAFLASSVTIVMVVFTGVIGLYPSLIPSRMDPVYSLTIFNSSSSVYTLKIMTGVVLLFVPVVIAYQVWIYRIFRSRLTPQEVEGDEEAY